MATAAFMLIAFLIIMIGSYQQDPGMAGTTFSLMWMYLALANWEPEPPRREE